MSITLEVTPASEVKELRAGVAFVIRDGEHIRCSGRIKPSGRTVVTGSGFPTASITARMAFIADLYSSEGMVPEDLTFEEERYEGPDDESEGRQS